MDHYGGAMVIPRSPKSTRNEKKFQDRQIFFLLFKSYMILKYLLIIDYPKFDPLTEAGMAYVEKLGQNFKIYSPWSQTKRNQV